MAGRKATLLFGILEKWTTLSARRPHGPTYFFHSDHSIGSADDSKVDDFARHNLGAALQVILPIIIDKAVIGIGCPPAVPLGSVPFGSVVGFLQIRQLDDMAPSLDWIKLLVSSQIFTFFAS
jgi:hypothetical protein